MKIKSRTFVFNAHETGSTASVEVTLDNCGFVSVLVGGNVTLAELIDVLVELDNRECSK